MSQESTPSVERLVVARVFDANQQLLAVIPNKKDFLRVLTLLEGCATESGAIAPDQVNAVVGLLKEALEQSPLAQQQSALLEALQSGNASIEHVTTQASGLLDSFSEKSASAQECDLFIELLNEGKVRAAEKVQGIWEPQTYVIDGILNYFKTHDNQRLGTHDWDKIPLKTAQYQDQDFIDSGVRYAPGSIVRTGAYIGPQTVIMNQAFVNIGAYIAGEGVMIDGGTRIASCAQIGKGVKFGAGSGIEGILEPAGRMPSIVEDHVKIGAMCEVTGIIGEGAVIASGVIMASGKKIYDEATGEIVPPQTCPVGDQTFLLPVIPPYRLAVGGALLDSEKSIATDAIILKPGDLRETQTLKHFEKQGILYQ